MNSTSQTQMTGSAKQIAWATSIRDTLVATMIDYLTRACARAPEGGAEHLAKCTGLIAEYSARHADARYWIDNRDLCAHDHFARVVAGQ